VKEQINGITWLSKKVVTVKSVACGKARVYRSAV
jgi:hypothetical protein